MQNSFLAFSWKEQRGKNLKCPRHWASGCDVCFWKNAPSRVLIGGALSPGRRWKEWESTPRLFFICELLAGKRSKVDGEDSVGQ
jgi:hypothetical protein